MGLLARKPDQRLSPRAYVTDGTRLYEVLAVEATTVRLEDCATGSVSAATIGRALSAFRIVRAAPAAAEIPAPGPLDGRGAE